MSSFFEPWLSLILNVERLLHKASGASIPEKSNSSGGYPSDSKGQVPFGPSASPKFFHQPGDFGWYSQLSCGSLSLYLQKYNPESGALQIVSSIMMVEIYELFETYYMHADTYIEPVLGAQLHECPLIVLFAMFLSAE